MEEEATEVSEANLAGVEAKEAPAANLAGVEAMEDGEGEEGCMAFQ